MFERNLFVWFVSDCMDLEFTRQIYLCYLKKKKQKKKERKENDYK